MRFTPTTKTRLFLVVLTFPLKKTSVNPQKLNRNMSFVLVTLVNMAQIGFPRRRFLFSFKIEMNDFCHVFVQRSDVNVFCPEKSPKTEKCSDSLVTSLWSAPVKQFFWVFSVRLNSAVAR